VQPLPALAPGHYTVGVQVLDDAGNLARGTFGFTVDPSAVPAAGAGSGPAGIRLRRARRRRLAHPHGGDSAAATDRAARPATWPPLKADAAGRPRKPR
jgi:hypothetical protein